MRQLDAELRRFFARRIVQGAFLVAALIIVLAVSIGTAKGHPATRFSLDPVTGRVTDLKTGRVVDRQAGSYQYSASDQQGHMVFGDEDTRMNVGKDLGNMFQGTGITLLFAAFAIGASFVGAEFNVGSLTTQLLFEPRRWRVHLAKAVAVGLGAAVLAFAVLVFLALAMYAGSELKGVVSGLDGSFLWHRTLQALRVASIVGAGAIMAYAVTLVAKRSSAGILAFFLQFVLLGLIDPKKMPFGLISHYAPVRGLIAAIVKHTAESGGVQDRAIHTTAGGVVLTTVWIVVIVAGSGFLFGRAEVR